MPVNIGSELCGEDSAFALMAKYALNHGLLHDILTRSSARRQNICGIAHQQSNTLLACKSAALIRLFPRAYSRATLEKCFATQQIWSAFTERYTLMEALMVFMHVSFFERSGVIWLQGLISHRLVLLVEWRKFIRKTGTVLGQLY